MGAWDLILFIGGAIVPIVGLVMLVNGLVHGDGLGASVKRFLATLWNNLP